MPNGVVFKIKKYALHDGPGIRTTVFLKGCPLHCWWCHNPEGICADPQVLQGRRRVVMGQSMSVQQVMAEIQKDTVFYEQSGGGVTFSGGEPLMQPLFLEALLAACRRQGLHTAIDTSGHAPAQTFLHLAAQADLILFDIKLMDPLKHRTYTGRDNKLILENFRSLCRLHPDVRARLPLIPGVTDGEQNIRAIADLLSTCAGLSGADLLPYHRIGDHKYDQLGMARKMAGLASPPSEAVRAVQSMYQRCGVSAALGA